MDRRGALTSPCFSSLVALEGLHRSCQPSVNCSTKMPSTDVGCTERTSQSGGRVELAEAAQDTTHGEAGYTLSGDHSAKSCECRQREERVLHLVRNVKWREKA